MTVPASGSVSFSDLRKEFGLSGPVSLSGLYRSSPNVINDFTPNMSIPLSGAIGLNNFRGAEGYRFLKTHDSCSNGSAGIAPGGGLPVDYNLALHGKPIWPTGKGVNESGYLGKKFVTPTSQIRILFSCDNIVGLFINGTYVGGSFNADDRIEVIHWVVQGSVVTLSASVTDEGGEWGFVCSVSDMSGNIITQSDNTWVSGKQYGT